MVQYVCIVKTPEKHLKYHVIDLLKFTLFLDKNYPNWKWFNVYDKRTREKLASFTINDRPTKRKIHP